MTRLLSALIERRLHDGFQLLDGCADEFTSLSAATRDGPPMILCLALWTDAGYRTTASVRQLLAGFSPGERRKLSVQEYLSLQMSQAFCCMAAEDLEAALPLLEFVIHAQQELGETALLAVCHFWKARCHRKRGEYDLAMKHLAAGRDLTRSTAPRFAAVLEVQESWLTFQRGKSAEALRLLEHAQEQLSGTDDWLTLGNIASARGRISRQAGRYTEALQNFDEAVKLYTRLDPNHRNLARALVNAAYTKRLIALQLRRRIDSRAARPQKGREPGNRTIGGDHGRYVQACREALEQLRRAGEVYDLHGQYSGIGSVLVNTGYLHLDSGAADLAATEATKAYDLAQSKKDHVLMARARILQSAVENARVEECPADEAEVALHADAAKQYSEEAVALAESTQIRSLTAEAYIALGTTAANDFFQDWEEARRSSEKASVLLSPGERDHAWEDLLLLKARVLRASGIDDTLRAWSEGIVGNKTFQQVTEEFAEIVIPKVWLREGKRVSRVAERLSVSPKKVRRILRVAGLLQRNGDSKPK